MSEAEERAEQGLEPFEVPAPPGYSPVPENPERHVRTPGFRAGRRRPVVKQEPEDEIPGPSTSTDTSNRGHLKEIDYSRTLPPLLELELLSEPDHINKLADLLVTKQLTNLSTTPVDIRKIYHLLDEEDRKRLAGNIASPDHSSFDDDDTASSSSDSENCDHDLDSDHFDEFFDDESDVEEDPEIKKKDEKFDKDLMTLYDNYTKLGKTE